MKHQGIWDTVQGEGLYTGQPSTFIRLAGCNLRCTWCDTPHSLPDYDVIKDKFRLNVTSRATEIPATEAAWELVRSDPKHIVITGGEPLLQVDDVSKLIGDMPGGIIYTIETNGTVEFTEGLPKDKMLLSFSPKVWEYNDFVPSKTVESIATWIDAGYKYQLKIVLASEEELDPLVEMMTTLMDYSIINPPTWAAVQIESGMLRRGLDKKFKARLIAKCKKMGVRLVAQMHPVLKVA